MQLKDLLQNISDFIWGPPLLILLVGTGGIFNLKVKATSNIQITTSFKIRIWKR